MNEVMEFVKFKKLDSKKLIKVKVDEMKEE